MLSGSGRANRAGASHNSLRPRTSTLSQHPKLRCCSPSEPAYSGGRPQPNASRGSSCPTSDRCDGLIASRWRRPAIISASVGASLPGRSTPLSKKKWPGWRTSFTGSPRSKRPRHCSRPDWSARIRWSRLPPLPARARPLDCVRRFALRWKLRRRAGSRWLPGWR